MDIVRALCLLGLLSFPAAASSLGGDELPSMEDCRRAMDAAWTEMPPFRAEFVHHAIEAPRDLVAAGKLPRWHPNPGEAAAPENTGWIVVHPDWFAYRYIQPTPRFD